MTMTNETTTNADAGTTNETNKPDYVARQYRIVRIEDGWRTRKERIGVAWNTDKGGICFRPSGQQIIEGDIYLYPFENETQE